MITTPSTASQAPAVTIADDDEFIDLMHALSSVPSSVYAGNEFSKVINYIDAKLAQAEARATAAEAKMEAIRQGVEGLPWTYQRTGGYGAVTHESVDRAAVLALLQHQEPEPEPKVKYTGGPVEARTTRYRLADTAQHQADESGLPG